MAEEAATAAPATEKVYDISKQVYVDKPIVDTTSDEKPPEEVTPPEEKKPDEKPEKEPEAKKDEVAKPKDFEPGAYIKEKWGDKFGLDSEAALEKTLAAQQKMLADLQKLQTENETLKKPSDPVYRSEQEKKIAEFLKPYDPSKFGDGLNTVAAIMGIDPVNISARQALEEAYIIRHPDLTRQEATELFADEYDAGKLNRDDFDNDEAYEKKKRIYDIKEKNEVAQARKELADKKESLKAPPEEKKPDVNKPAEAPEAAVKAYTKDIETFFNPSKGKKFDSLHYLSDDEKETYYTLVLDEEKIEDVKGFMKAFVENPASYTKDGKIPNFTPQELAKTALRLLHGDWMEESIWKQVKVLATKLKAEQIAGIDPDKKSTGTGDVKLSVTDQFAALGQKEAEKRKIR